MLSTNKASSKIHFYSSSLKESDILFVWCRVPSQTPIDKSIKAT